MCVCVCMKSIKRKGPKRDRKCCHYILVSSLKANYWLLGEVITPSSKIPFGIDIESRFPSLLSSKKQTSNRIKENLWYDLLQLFLWENDLRIRLAILWALSWDRYGTDASLRSHLCLNHRKLVIKANFVDAAIPEILLPWVAGISRAFLCFRNLLTSGAGLMFSLQSKCAWLKIPKIECIVSF